MICAKILKILGFFSFLIFVLVSCQSGIPKKALTLSPESLKDRQLQTRIFETGDEKNLLTASAAVLQDLCFSIDESEIACGVIVSSRDRDVTDVGEVLLSYALEIASVLLLAPTSVPYAEKQKVLASLVTRPADGKSVAVRITFQHIVWDSDGNIMKNESLNEPEIYQTFFSRLSKSVLLTAYEL